MKWFTDKLLAFLSGGPGIKRGRGGVVYPVHAPAVAQPAGASCAPEPSGMEGPEANNGIAPHNLKVALLAVFAIPKAFLNYVKGCLHKKSVDASNTVDTEVTTFSWSGKLC